jgi:hypothetical protein
VQPLSAPPALRPPETQAFSEAYGEALVACAVAAALAGVIGFLMIGPRRKPK